MCFAFGGKSVALKVSVFAPAESDTDSLVESLPLPAVHRDARH